jgi:hypothetical protein
MLSLKKCRTQLPLENRDKSDEELRAICDQMYAVARLLVNSVGDIKIARLHKKKHLLSNQEHGNSSTSISIDAPMIISENYEYEERAAIHEFEGNAERILAEKMASEEMAAIYRN